MRRFLIAVALAMAVVGAGSFASTPASAMTLNGSQLDQAVKKNDGTEQVRLVCRRYWNGYRWVRRCWRTHNYYYAPRYYRPYRYYRRHHYYYY